MLKTRIITALVLLAILLPVLFAGSFIAFAVVAVVFFAAAAWESARLFGVRRPVWVAGAWVALLLTAMPYFNPQTLALLFMLCVALWAVRFVPALAVGLPQLGTLGNRLLGVSYGATVFGCFVAIAALFLHSPLYLLSVMALVWIADIGAYFCGRTFGKRKLAVTISPGKSWEGAIGGWILVLLLASLSTLVPALADTFAVHLLSRSWVGGLAILTLISAASVIGDLFESMLKRRAGMKDSSNLLPGHGGVLDRIDALIPVLPLAAFLSLWLG